MLIELHNGNENSIDVTPKAVEIALLETKQVEDVAKEFIKITADENGYHLTDKGETMNDPITWNYPEDRKKTAIEDFFMLIEEIENYERGV